MTNKLHILANGCSNTYGAGLIDQELERTLELRPWIDQESHRMAWPNQLKQLLNAEQSTNLAVSMGSNQRIIRTTLEWCRNQKQDLLDNTIAVIQWTHCMRYEYYVPQTLRKDHRLQEPLLNVTTADPLRWARVKPNCRSGVELEPQTIAGYDLEELVQLRYLLWTEQEGAYRDIECYHSLESIFRQFGIRYFYWHLLGYQLPQELELYAKNTFSWVDPANPNGSGWQYDRLQCQHPSEQGHRQIAELIAEHIKNRI